MHTEGSVIFSSPQIYESKDQLRQRWRWNEVKRLLDSNNSEPCHSSILALLEDYQQRAPPIVQAIKPDWLNLAFSDHKRIEAVVAEALAAEPNINTPEFRKFIRSDEPTSELQALIRTSYPVC